MAKLFFFIAVALILVSASAARSAPAPQVEGVVVPANGSHVEPAQFQIQIGDDGRVNCVTLSAENCMLGILQEASNLPFCNKKCNVLIAANVGKFTTLNIDSPYAYQEFIIDDGSFKIWIFHGNGYAQTTGWYGWLNWAFSGNFVHTNRTGIVQFFPYGAAP